MASTDIDLIRYASLAKTTAARDLFAGEALLLHRQDGVSQYWAPFDHIPPTARLAVVGITPGREQANNALHGLRQALLAGHDIENALRHAKLVGSFSGPMRANIVQMLDAIGAHEAFRVASCAELFDPMQERMHFTSALRYPVFVGAANYNGTPDMLRTPMLRTAIETHLAEEVRRLPDALWLPLGPKPTAALKHLVSHGVLAADRVLEGMPHPSGANAERIKFFLGLKPRAALSNRTRPDLIEVARQVLVAQVARLRSA